MKSIEFIQESIEDNIETFQLEKGLSNAEAWKKVKNKLKYDHRGFNYNPKTGKATAI